MTKIKSAGTVLRRNLDVILNQTFMLVSALFHGRRECTIIL